MTPGSFQKRRFAKEEHQIANAIELHLKSKQRQLLKQQLLAQGFMKNEFNNVLAMDSIVSIDGASPNCANRSTGTTNTALLPLLHQTQPTVTTATSTSVGPSIFKRSSSTISTSILQPDCSDPISETFANLKMPKIFLKDVSGKFIRSFGGKESNGNKINIKLNKLHFINSPAPLADRLRSPVASSYNSYKVFDTAETHPTSTMISCR